MTAFGFGHHKYPSRALRGDGSGKVNDEIRLLKLYPRGTESKVAVEFIIQELGGALAHPYKALSYTWGTSLADTALEVNSTIYLPTQNLYDALWHMSGSIQEFIFLWVDATCIDQSNEGEVSQQIGLMRQIYEGATETIIWLGHADDGCELAFSLIPGVSNLSKDICSTLEVKDSPESVDATYLNGWYFLEYFFDELQRDRRTKTGKSPCSRHKLAKINNWT